MQSIARAFGSARSRLTQRQCALKTLTDAGVLRVLMLKRNRRGHYADGCTNASTFWHAVLAGAKARAERLPCAHPPVHYYSAPELE